MRRINATMEKRLNQRVQTHSTGSAPSTDLWISRPTTALTQAQFLEQQTVTATGSSDLSIAVCHPRFGASNNRIYIAYIQDGVARVTTSRTYVRMDAHIWVDTDFEEPAQAVSIAFDGRMPKNRAGQIEFITEDKPWVFWVNAGALYARKLGTEATVTLAESSCTDVSAVRAMWSEVGSFDFGLCVFFILSGTIYYRQLIGGEWMDAAPVAFGPEGVTWVEIAAQRTWDYRVALQAKASDGTVYELITQYMGVGKQLTEHISADVKADANCIAIAYRNTKTDEHIEASVNPSAKRIYAFSSVPVSAANVDDGTGNYGTIVHVGLDYPVSNVDGNSTSFSMTDGNGIAYSCTNSVASADGMTLILTFVDFNPAEGTTLTVDYVPGTIQSPATAMEAFSFTFAPENLVAPNIPAPEPIEAWNLDAKGTEIAIRFSEAITGDISANEDKFAITTQEYDMVPGGVLAEKPKVVTGIKGYASFDETVDLSACTMDGVAFDTNKLTLGVDGSG